MLALVLQLLAVPNPCAELPAEVPHLKSRTESFNLIAANETGAPRLFFRVHGGRICARLVADENDESWRPFLGRGAPEQVREISADGRNLIAIDDDGVVHYTKLHAIRWTDRWLALPLVGTIHGLLFGGELVMPPNRGWSISHRGPENAYYEDIAGKKHRIGAGVTTLYVLSADGRSILYADPWLPNGWDNQIPMPEGGRFVAEVMSASASTLFVMARARDAEGRESHRLYTRLIDFDTEGNNPFLMYSYEVDDDPEVRTLPAEDWRAQPAIPLDGRARLTNRIAIFQSGEGNAARTLRVEGTDESGQRGYWEKGIDAPTWLFVATGHTIDPRGFLDAPRAFESAPPVTIDCQHGALTQRPRIPWRVGESVPATLTGFADGQVGARVHAEVAGEMLELPIYSRRRLGNLIGDNPPSHTLVIPGQYFEEPLASHPEVQRVLDEMFNGQRVIPVVVEHDEYELHFESKTFSRARFELSFAGCGPSP